MILLIGPAYSGKEYFLKDTLELSQEEIEQYVLSEVQDLLAFGQDGPGQEGFDCPNQATELRNKMNKILQNENKTTEKPPKEELLEMCKNAVITTVSEVGGGIVPVDLLERQFRREAGTLAQELACEATVVLRIFCGLPEFLKGDESVLRKELAYAHLDHSSWFDGR